MDGDQSGVRTAQTYRLRTQLLKKGRSHRILASSRNAERAMNVAIKCYAEGGENEFHAHAQEDHTFVVLQGGAVFYQPDQPPQKLGHNEGILIPAGAFYKFEAVSGEPLVLLRVGNAWQPVAGAVVAENSRRLGKDGALLQGHSAANKHEDPVAIDGAWYE